MNKNNIILLVIIVVIILGAGFLVFSNKEGVPQELNGIILFYKVDCPHCQTVEKFIEDNKMQDAEQFEQKEVTSDQSNINLLAVAAKICKIPVDQVGVPFLWDGKTCIVGDQPIIDFFTNKLVPAQ